MVLFHQETVKESHVIIERCSMVSSIPVQPSSCGNRRIQAAPLASMCYHNEDLFFEKVKETDVEQLKDVLKSVLLSLSLQQNVDNNRKDTGVRLNISSEDELMGILSDLNAVYSEVSEGWSIDDSHVIPCPNMVYDRMAEIIYDELSKKTNFDAAEKEKITFDLSKISNGWIKLYKVIQCAKVSLMFHDNNVSFLMGEIMRLGNFRFSRDYHHGLVEKKDLICKEKSIDADEITHNYILDVNEDFDNVKDNVKTVNQFLSADSLLVDLRRLV